MSITQPAIEVAAQLPDEIAPETDLIEIRVAVDPDKRSYTDEAGG